jgi:hypothetical protein
MPYGSVLTDSITDSSGGVLAPSSSVFRNRIINGAMSISQGAAGATITPAVSSAYATNYPVDRFQVIVGAASKLTTAQSSTAPTGFNFSTLITSSSAYTVGSGEVFVIRQSIEGFNTADLAWGTASAASVTLSFWVRSSLTGTFGGSVQNSASDRSYPFTYTISSANTWEKKTVTIAGDTSGTWIGATNGIGLRVNFGLGVGSTYSGTAGAWAGSDYDSATGATSVVGTNGATFYITGVQLEKGSTATSFDYRPYGTELALAQRYLPAFTTDTANPSVVGSGGFSTSTRIAVQYTFPVTPRTSPTGITVSSAAHFNVTDNVLGTACTAVTFNASGLSCAQVYFDTATTYAAYRSGVTYSSNASAKILFNGCEL